MGHGAWGIVHWALGIGHWAWENSCFPAPLLLATERLALSISATLNGAAVERSRSAAPLLAPSL